MTTEHVVQFNSDDEGVTLEFPEVSDCSVAETFSIKYWVSFSETHTATKVYQHVEPKGDNINDLSAACQEFYSEIAKYSFSVKADVVYSFRYNQKVDTFKNLALRYKS